MAGITADAAKAMSVSLQPSVPSPSPVGTIVTWNASVADQAPGTLWYRFRTRQSGQDFHVMRDYGPLSSLDWTVSDWEGTYEIEVSVRNTDTQDVATTTAVYDMTSRVTGSDPVISPTANPLVFLYSAPPCEAGALMRVQFQSQNGIMQTPSRSCQDGLSMNFYLAGMRPGTTYSVWHVIETGSGLVTGPRLALTTGTVSLPIAGYTVLQSRPVSGSGGILLQSTLFEPTVATDLNGNLVWFYPGKISLLTRSEGDGLFLGITEVFAAGLSDQIVREFDLAGTAVRETNAARISEQLVAMGKRPITGFHHEARGLADGRILVLGSTEQIMTDVQGPGPVDVLGDMILVLDQDLQLVWAWDAFDHLDPTRRATLNEVCLDAGSGCPPFRLASKANDWLHGNALQFTPDGNILYSVRHQDWVIKIDYSNGAGTGNIIWRLGKDGDFRIDSNDASPWFSHQHDPGFATRSNSELMLFDNGNVRQSLDPKADSRGQVLTLDEAHRVASFILNADLGAYSLALGTAQRLSNGDYHFDAGWLPDQSSHSIEVDDGGAVVFSIQAATPEYRSFRMKDLYTLDEYVPEPQARLKPLPDPCGTGHPCEEPLDLSR